MTRQECGRRRYLCRYRIRAVLVEQGISMAGLGRRLGVTAEIVSATVLGKKHSPKVLNALREIGVAERYLFDPRHQKVAA